MEKWKSGGWGWGVALLESLLWPCNQIQTFGDTLTAHLRCLSVVKSSQGCEGRWGWEKRGVGCKDNNKCGFYDLCNYRLQPEVGGAGLQESHCRNPWESRSRRVNSFLARLVFLSFLYYFFFGHTSQTKRLVGESGKSASNCAIFMNAVGGGGRHSWIKDFPIHPDTRTNRLLSPNLLCCWPCRVQIISSKCTATPTQLSRSGRAGAAKKVWH